MQTKTKNPLKFTAMIKAFTIFKQGVTTEGPVTILIPEDIFTDELLQFKINKYIFLGYEVKVI